jgi:DNA-binding SARP family transcriptional activator
MAEALHRLELRCLGPPAVLVDGREPPSDVLWRKHVALLVYLALSPECTRSREHLLGLLWPEKTQEKARHSLNEALRRLRGGLGTERIVTNGDVVRLSTENLAVDALEFEQHAASDPHSDLLEGFVVEDAPAFEGWAEEQRRHYRSRATSLLVAAGEMALAANRFADAQDIARRALTVEPASETAASLLMRAEALTGDATAALQAYHDYAERLEQDIGEKPSRELQALAERIRSNRWRGSASRHAELAPPLVGRAETYRTAFELMDEGVGSGARCLLVTGDVGMGKTRLLNECVDRLALAGAVTAVARPLETDLDTAWSTLRLLLRAGLVNAPGAAGTEPHAMAVLAAIVPELAERVEPAEPRDASDVAAALGSLLRAIADEQPVAIAIDDAHLADGPSISALSACVSGLDTEPVVVVLGSASSVEEIPQELLHLMGDLGRSIRGELVRLDPLSQEAARELVEALAPWCAAAEDRDRLMRRLAFEAGGNPLMSVTLLRGLEKASTLREDLLRWPKQESTYDSPLPFSVPQLARMTLISRVSQLEDEERGVLSAASICGMSLDLTLIAALTELPMARVEETLDRLEQFGFVAFDGRRYAFAAAMYVQIVRGECLTPGQRQRYRRRAITELSGRDDLESRLLRVELQIKAEPGEQLIDEALDVARAAREAGSLRTYRRALVLAERVAGENDAASRAAIEKLRGEISA